MTWYCIVTNPNCQRRCEAELAANGYRVFWPKLRKWVSHARTKVAKEYPVLGRYVFVEVGEGQSFGFVRGINGVECFVTLYGAPMAMPTKDVEEFLMRYINGEWDYVRQEVCPDGKGGTRHNKPFPIGARLRIMQGEFEDRIASLRNISNGKLVLLVSGQREFISMKARGARAA